MHFSELKMASRLITSCATPLGFVEIIPDMQTGFHCPGSRPQALLHPLPAGEPLPDLVTNRWRPIISWPEGGAPSLDESSFRVSPPPSPRSTSSPTVVLPDRDSLATHSTTAPVERTVSSDRDRRSDSPSYCRYESANADDDEEAEPDNETLRQVGATLRRVGDDLASTTSERWFPFRIRNMEVEASLGYAATVIFSAILFNYFFPPKR